MCFDCSEIVLMDITIKHSSGRSYRAITNSLNMLVRTIVCDLQVESHGISDRFDTQDFTRFLCSKQSTDDRHGNNYSACPVQSKRVVWMVLTIYAMKHDGESIMIWGSFSANATYTPLNTTNGVFPSI